MAKVYDLAVIGGGGAGQMAILRSVLNYLDTVAFLGDAQAVKRSRHTWVHDVENIPGMFDKKRPITSTSKEVLNFIEGRPELKKKLTLIRKSVTKIKKQGDQFILNSDGEEYPARYVVLCTGTMDVQPHIQGSIEPIFPYANKGDVLYCIRCDGHKTIGKTCAVIGHDETAAWVTILLKERYDLPQIWILTNGKKFDCSAKNLKILKQYSIPIIEGPITKILGDPKEGLAGFDIEGEKIPAEMAFIALGSIVYNELAKQLGAEVDERDHIVTRPHYETSVPGLYAAGDLVAGKKKQVYTSWDMAVDAVDHIDSKIRKAKREGNY